ncbi:NUDIX hydrolase [Saprospiraceae bacterium]|nr:NUDIX hydrolase [Saprospiraceae bacterium]
MIKIKQNILLAVDAVVFGYRNNHLVVLLIKQKYGSEKDKWALPGGFVKDDESLEEAVARELKEETSITVNYLEQLYSFGSVSRDSRNRVVSVAYLGLINPDHVTIEADSDASDVAWFKINELPKLAFDHCEIVQKAIERLKSKINYQPIGFELLATKFPFSDLENLYQTILGQSIDRRNFRKKLNSFGLLIELEEYHKSTGSGRPGKLFMFDKAKYQAFTKAGFMFEIKFA